MSILVTGASGFIGSYLCRALVSGGHRVAALTRSGRTDNISSLLPDKNFSLHTGDIQDTAAMSRVIEDNRIKTVFHLAARLPGESDMDNPMLCFDVNVRGTLSVLHAARRSGVEKLVYASSMSVYSEPPRYLPVDEEHPVQPLTAYGASKLAGELCCRLYAGTMDMVVLRYGGVYGKGQRESDALLRFIRQASASQPLTIFGDGTQSSDFVYIDDVIQGTLLAWEKGEAGVYNIGSGQETGIRELAERIIDITGSGSEVVMTGRESQRPFRFVLDVTKARKLLGYSPRLLDEGLHQYLGGMNDKE